MYIETSLSALWADVICATGLYIYMLYRSSRYITNQQRMSLVGELDLVDLDQHVHVYMCKYMQEMYLKLMYM